MERLSQRIHEHCMKIELIMKDIHDCEAKRYIIKMFERMKIDDKQSTGHESAYTSQSRPELKR